MEYGENLNATPLLKTPLVYTRNLSKAYNKGTYVLQDVNLQIMPGRIVGLLGPNGSGKTTFIKILNGLLQPTSGDMFIDGGHPGPHSKQVISYLPDHTYLTAKQKVSEIIDFFADFYKDFDPALANKMLADLGIESNAYLKTLSKGTKEKVQLILVMSRHAKLYVLDEPIAGVDPATRDYIMRTILSNYHPDSSILICTHLISDVEPILNDVIFLKNGRIVEQDTAEHIKEKSGKTIDQYFREVFAC